MLEEIVNSKITCTHIRAALSVNGTVEFIATFDDTVNHKTITITGLDIEGIEVGKEYSISIKDKE